MNLLTQIAQTHELNSAIRLAATASSGTKGILHIADGAFKGMLYFESGRVVAAQIIGKQSVSLSALQEIVQHKQAAFRFENGSAPPDLKRINFPFQELLKEGLQLKEQQDPADPSVIGKAIDDNSLSTLANTVMVDPDFIEKHKRLLEED